jgi:hypothetical protein
MKEPEAQQFRYSEPMTSAANFAPLQQSPIEAASGAQSSWSSMRRIMDDTVPSGGGPARVNVCRHSLNPTLTLDANPGVLKAKTERTDASAMNEALANRTWGLPATRAAVRPVHTAYEMCRMQKKRDQQLQANNNNNNAAGGGGCGCGANGGNKSLSSWQADMPATITSINGRHTEFNTAKREFGLTEANRKVLQRTPLKLSEVARMRAQLEEGKRFNEQLMAQLNNRSSLPPGGTNGDDPTLSIQILNSTPAANRTVPDDCTTSLVTQLLEDKIQTDKLRDRLVFLQGQENLRIKATNKRRAEEEAMVSCAQQQHQTMPAYIPSKA